MCPGGPHSPNQFATKCTMDKDKSFTCTNCETGYTGRRCEQCSDGFYGDPNVNNLFLYEIRFGGWP